MMYEDNFTKLFKDVREIYGRIFDHRAFLCGEQKFFIREFEEKRHDGAFKNLLTVKEKVIEMNETEIDSVKKNVGIYINDATNTILAATSMLDSILGRIEKDEEKVTDILQKNRISRRNEWDSYVADIQDEMARFDSVIMKNERELIVEYDSKEASL